jgi:hypothetical protein
MRLSTEQRRQFFGRECDPKTLVTVVTPWNIAVKVHRLVERRFQAACKLAASASQWRPARIDSYNCRSIRGSTTPSLHSWGLAWDFFDAVYPKSVWGPENAPHPSFTAAFERLGFSWGGRWEGRRDYPHIEWSGPPPVDDRQPYHPSRRPRMILVQPEGQSGVYLVFGRGDYVPIEDPVDRDRIMAAGVPLVELRASTWQEWSRR